MTVSVETLGGEGGKGIMAVSVETLGGKKRGKRIVAVNVETLGGRRGEENNGGKC